MNPLTYVGALAGLALLVGWVKASLIYRAHTMRALAVSQSLRYVGPPSMKWWGLLKSEPPIPIPFWLRQWPNVRVVWNAIEGQHEGVQILIFDCLIGTYGRNSSHYRTFFACKTEQNPFSTDSSPGHAVQSRGGMREQVVQSHGWTVVYQSPRFLEVPWRTWSMSTHDLIGYMQRCGSLRAGELER